MKTTAHARPVSRTLPRIVFVIRALDIGGAQRQLVELAGGLSRLGWGVRVLTFYGGGALGKTDLPYSPNAMAARATGAAKPTVADTQPATKPKAG